MTSKGHDLNNIRDVICPFAGQYSNLYCSKSNKNTEICICFNRIATYNSPFDSFDLNRLIVIKAIFIFDIKELKYGFDILYFLFCDMLG